MNAEVTYLDGWYAEERDGARQFRWMGRMSRCRVEGRPPDHGWLRIEAGHASSGLSPNLTVSVDGQVVGSRAVCADPAPYLFSMPASASEGATVHLELDRTFTVAGDTRELGIAVWSCELVGAERVGEDGWYGWQDDEYFPFRWMGLDAHVVAPDSGTRYCALPACSLMADGSQTLTFEDGERIAEVQLLNGWHIYDIALPSTRRGAAGNGTARWTLRLNQLAPMATHPDDPRELGIKVAAFEPHDDARRHELARKFQDAVQHDAAPPSESRPGAQYLPDDRDGWYWWEFQDEVPFRWMQREASLCIPADVRGSSRFCTVPVFSEFADWSQRLTISSAGETLIDVPLARCWSYCTFALPRHDTGDLVLALSLNKIVPPSQLGGDRRELGVRVGPLRFHDDEARQEGGRFTRQNAELNRREMESGATVLSSFPTNVGIDLYAKCNIVPACVYCPWDRMKEMEGGAISAVVDERTFEEWGPFFEGAQTLTNCSFGEPLLHPRLAEVLDFFDKHDKLVQLSSNGQAFTPASVRALAGKRVSLFVSLDSASPGTYARLRNDRWNDVIVGLTHLRDARRRSNGLPKLNMVFMPMRANLHDLENYFKLCRMVAADCLVLRPLLRLEQSGIVVDRGGYHYDYDRELLERDELERVFDDVNRWQRQYRVAVSSQFEFGL